MQGLFDFLKTPEGQGLLSGVASLAAGARRGAPINSLGMGLLGGIQGYGGALDRQQQLAQQAKQDELRAVQIANFKSEIEARNLATEQANRRMGYLSNLLGQLDNAAPQANQVVASQTGNLAPTRANASLHDQALAQVTGGNPLAGIPRQAIQWEMATGDGKKIGDWIFDRSKPNIEFINGVAVDKNRTQAGTSLPQMSPTGQGYQIMPDPTAPGGYRIIEPSGARDLYSSYRNADEAAKAAYQLLPLGYVDAGTGRPMGGTVGEYINSRPLPNRGGGTLTPELSDIIKADAARNGITNPQANFVGGGPNAVYGVSRNAPQKTAPSGTLQSPAEAAAAEAAAKLPAQATSAVNESWVKTSYEPTLEAAKTAGDAITNVKVARDSLRQMGGTGWGTEVKAGAASVLSGLGIAPENAQMFAANAEKFQNVAMDNLWTKLNAAKGPQTEGDADRARKTFAQLKNTPQANEFILDLAEARAMRDQMKADFYRQALPIAQKKGDLAEVDREWSKRAPSVFSMPTMKRWGVR